MIATVEKRLNKRRNAEYRAGIRSVVRGLWSGVLDFDQAFDAMLETIETGLTRAWEQGAAECDILPDELTVSERTALTHRIAGETNRINGFLEVIETNDKVSGGKLTPLFKRAELWAKRYLDVFNQALETACKDEKLIWRLGATEKHCNTCPRLDGKVKRASFWKQSGIHPQRPPNSALDCGGWE